MTRTLALACLLVGLLASGCAAPQTALEAEVTQAAADLSALQTQVAGARAEQTARAQTAAAVPPPTSTPTSAPTPTRSPTPTRTAPAPIATDTPGAPPPQPTQAEPPAPPEAQGPPGAPAPPPAPPPQGCAPPGPGTVSVYFANATAGTLYVVLSGPDQYDLFFGPLPADMPITGMCENGLLPGTYQYTFTSNGRNIAGSTTFVGPGGTAFGVAVVSYTISCQEGDGGSFSCTTNVEGADGSAAYLHGLP
jgi:hypothetical protein